MKSLKEFINESFSAKTIKEFIKIIEDFWDDLNNRFEIKDRELKVK